MTGVAHLLEEELKSLIIREYELNLTTLDATLQWYGSKRLPDTGDKPVEFQRALQTPGYFLLNSQVSRGFRWGNIYLGVENLFDFTQDNPIIDPENPFGNDFDASMTWAPIAGRMIYAGFRYKIK